MAHSDRAKDYYACCGRDFQTKDEFEKHTLKVHAGTGAMPGGFEHGGATTGSYEPVPRPPGMPPKPQHAVEE
jgi:hypothetical protein